MTKKLLLTLLAFTSFTFLKAQQIDTLTGPTGSQYFGSHITVLINGNYVVTDPNFNDGVLTAVGAVYLYNGSNHTLISTLKGSNTNDRVGNNGITVLSNGNFVVRSSNWNGNRGAATWGNGITGISGTVSSTNSLVGSNANDYVGNGEITVLSNGNFVVRSTSWNGNRGAATWSNGSTGTSGTVSAANSLVGSNANDRVSNSGITFLSNGNYVVRSQNWNGNRGAATWGDGSSGISGTISSSNSLVGSNVNEYVSSYGISALSNGNYVVLTGNWNGNRGAATWGDGTTGITGNISSSNSLVGSNANDFVGNGDITALSNGNYVVRSVSWNGNRGAATWGDGTTGITGTVSSSNSLVGSNANDRVSSHGIIVLSNGNYVVRSPGWNGNRGASTWGDGTTGIVGIVSSANSLVGSNANDNVGQVVTALSNGNYVVSSQNWNGSRGAATWGDGSTGIFGTISSSNSLVGSNANDRVSNNGIIALSNGNYVVASSQSNGFRGSATWGNGTTGIIGTISSSNSLVGSNANDYVGSGITALSNGNYVVRSVSWNGNRGAATWGNGTTGIVGTVNSSNSLVGSNANDYVGSGIIALSNGNYVVASSQSNGFRGSATWGNGTTGIIGTISSSNSLVGSNANDRVSSHGITVLSNGNYVVRSLGWNGNRGAATWGDGMTGITGTVSSSNSLVGSIANDYISIGGITVLSNGNYVVRSGNWNGNRGAASISCNSQPIIGVVSSSNSVVGGSANLYVGQHSVVHNPIYDNVIISSQNENKVYIYSCASPVVCNLSSVLPTLAGTYTATNSGTDGNYTCYCDASNQLLLALDTNGTRAVITSDSVKLQIGNTVTTGWSNAGGIITNPNGGVVFNRKWDVKPVVQPSSPVKVKFFFTQAEYDSVRLRLSPMGTNIISPTQLEMYKLNNLSFGDPHASGTNGIIFLNGNTATSAQWEYAASGSDHSAEFLVSSFSGGGGGGGGGGFPLPIHLLEFNAIAHNNQSAKLFWQTSQEENLKHFEIERALGSENKTWEYVGTVDATNEQAINVYGLIDDNILTHAINKGETLIQYRLKIVDLDGSFTYSPIRLLFVNPSLQNASAINIYPIPSFGHVMVQMPETDNASIEVVNLLGSVVHKINQAAAQTTLDLSHLAKGVYIIKINIEGVVSHNKIVLE
jgi:hypothetical protein